MKPHLLPNPFLALAGSSLLAISSASAATRNWDGDTSTDWSTAGNWDTAPANDITTDIANFNLASYGGNPVYAPNAGIRSIAGITIGALNGAMTLTTTSLSIGGTSTGGIKIANGAGAFGITGGVTLGDAQTWSNNSANLFSVGGGTVVNGGFLLTVDGTGSSSISSTISGAGGLTKNGAGTLTLTGANDYTGTTTIGTGTLRGTQTSGTPFGTGAMVVANGTLSLAPTGSGSDVSLTGGTKASGTTFTYSVGAIFSLARGSQNSLTYTFGGGGATVSRGGSSNGSLILSTSDIANFGAQGSNLERFITNGNAPSQVNTLVSGVVIQDRNNGNAGDFAAYDATHGFTKASYTHTNTFTGSTKTSRVEINSATGSSATTAAYALKVSGATVTNTGNTITLGNGANAVAGLILNGGTIDGGTMTTSSASTQFVIYTSGTSAISSSINNGTTTGAGLNLIGPGTLDVSGSSGNSFTNGIQLRTTLIATNDNQLGASTGAIVMAGGTLQTSGTFALGGAGQRAITVNTGQDQIGSTFKVTSGTTTYQNASGKTMGGIGALIKTGAGTLVLSGNQNNGYSGGTFVNEGTLLVNNTSTGSGTGAGAVSVASGATLGGTGTASGAVTVSGIIAPGTSGIGTLNTGATTWNAGDAWKFDLSSTNNTSDKLAITGAFTKGSGSGFSFDFMGSQPFWNTTYTLLTFTSSSGFVVGDFDAAASIATLGSGSYSTSYFTLNSDSLTFTAIPEPSTALAGLLLTVGLLRRRRK